MIAGLLLALAAQLPAPQAPPRFLYLYRDSVKSGVDSAYGDIEDDGAQICADLRCPNPYFALESLSGVHEAWWINAFAGEPDTARVATAYATDRALADALGVVARRKAALIGTPVQGFAVYRPDLSRGPAWSVAGARFVVVTVTRDAEPADGTVWEARDSTLVVLRPVRTRRQADALASAPGARVFAVRPNWSMPAPAWVAADPAFWKLAPSPRPCTAPARGRALPAEFVAGRLFASWHLRSGERLWLYLDTGGNTWLYPGALAHLGAPVDTTVRAGTTMLTARVSAGLGDSLVLPGAPAGTGDTVRMMFSPQDAPDFGTDFPVAGLLGAQWFADRVWVLDYPGRRLLFNGTAATGPAAPECWVALGFQTWPTTGRRTTNFPRIPAEVDGVVIQFLLDTGARTTLTDSAWLMAGEGEPRQRAASFISESRFDEWHRRHPDWLVVPRAEEGDSAPMIRVPQVRVGGRGIGPVWFTRRPDRSFHQFMSEYTDEPVEGALGGSAWQHVILILDYPRARAAVVGDPS